VLELLDLRPILVLICLLFLWLLAAGSWQLAVGNGQLVSA
jgi:TRAP-type C4-dicarboxylate transport system permease small subunit